MGHIEFIKSIIAEINSVTVIGKENAIHVLSAIKMLEVLIQGITDEEKSREEAEQIRLDEMQRKRKDDFKKAFEKGETILGGETIQLDVDGNKKVIIQ